MNIVAEIINNPDRGYTRHDLPYADYYTMRAFNENYAHVPNIELFTDAEIEEAMHKMCEWVNR